MASGLPHPAYNNADITDAALVDRDLLVRWYAERGVPWGVRVPIGMSWSWGTHLFRKRLMDLSADDAVAAPSIEGLHLRRARAGDLERLVTADVAAFGGTPEEVRPWIAALLGASEVTYALGELDAETVTLGYLIRTDGLAGPAAYLSGVGVTSHAPDGVAAALGSWLLEQGFAGGAEFAHLHPDDTDGPTGVATWAGLGFAEVPGFEVYVDLT